MAPWLVEAFERYGYAVVVLGIFLESLGIPVPGETVLLAGGFFARRGSLGIVPVIGLAIAAAIAGDNAGYWIGRRGGRLLLERRGRLVGLTPERLATVDRFFARHGAKTVLFARFVSGVRVIAALFAGISRIPWRRFAVFEGLGAVLWATSIGTVGYVFGASWHLIERWFGRAALLAIALVVLIALLRALLRHPGELGPTVRQLGLVAGQLVACGLLATIGRQVARQHATALDSAASAAVEQLAAGHPALDRVMEVCNALGSGAVTVAVTLLVVFWSWRRGERAAALAMAAVAALGLALSADLAFAFRAARPAPAGGIAALYGFGFPSGHVTEAVAVYGMAAFLAGRHRARWRWPAAATAALVIVAIGFARVELGWQWLTDVLAGLAAGALVLLLGIYALQRAEASAARHPPSSPPAAPPETDRTPASQA